LHAGLRDTRALQRAGGAQQHDVLEREVVFTAGTTLGLDDAGAGEGTNLSRLQREQTRDIGGAVIG
jgi:hypothetical protein